MAIWMGVCVVALPAKAQSIVEMSPTRVIELGEQDESGQAPVATGLAVNRQGTRLAVGGDDHLVRILDARTGQVLHALGGHRDWVRAAAFRGDSQGLATAGDDRTIRLWKLSTEPSSRALPAWQGPVYALAFSPDGRMLAAGGFADKLRIYHGHDGRLLEVFGAPGHDVRAVVFSPDGLHLAAAGRQGRIRIFHLPSGRVVHDLVGPRRRIGALAYSPDGLLLAAAGDHHQVRLWNTATGLPAFDLPPLDVPAVEVPDCRCEVRALAFCGSSTLAVGGCNDLIRLWDLAARDERARLQGHTGSVAALAFHPQTGRLFSSGFDGTVRIWQLPPPTAPESPDTTAVGPLPATIRRLFPQRHGG